MHKKIIYSDLDGTLFNNENGKIYISDVNVEAVNKWIDDENYFSVATGRNIIGVRQYFSKSKIKHNLPMVLSNGTVLYDYDNDKIIFQELINKEVLNEAISFALNTDKALLLLMAANENFILKNESYAMPWVDFQHTVISKNEIDYNIINKAGFLLKKEDFNEVYEKVKNFKSIDTIELIPSSKVFIEFVNKGTSKATGIKRLLEHLSITDYRLYAIGDFDNDIDMLKDAHISFAPKGAQKKVLEVVDHILCDNNDGSVAEMITKLNNELNK
ncbi:MAG: Cof-type HAD-IIB family hydrolase [Acholeplasma sp.]|nr:Cof-type HAD-IIB family hydrolase [Acholeplasma sp.]